MVLQPFCIDIVDWPRACAEASRIREQVFVLEQGVPPELEMDEQDAHCDHALARTPEGTVVGTGRLLPDGHIGRMAVLKAWRGQGIGGMLLEHLVAQASKRGHARTRLNAQIVATGFYLRHGFSVVGPQFMEAGIAHVPMQRERDR